MAIQSSGMIAASDIQDEFGGSHPIGVNSEYGSEVGAGGTSEVQMSDFYGAANLIEFVVTLFYEHDYEEGKISIDRKYAGYAEASSASYYSSDGGGSISPGSIEGNDIDVLMVIRDSSTSFSQVVLEIEGTHAKSFIQEITLENIGTLLGSNATHSQESGFARWSWILGSGDVNDWFDSAGETRDVSINPG